jgi:hypothetical protein
MKKLYLLIPLVLSLNSCTTVIDDPEPTTTVTRETSTHVGYPATRTTTTIVEP